MQCSLTGLLNNAASHCECGRDFNGEMMAFSLRELYRNLRELKERTDAGDMTALKEFFELYVF
jgi:hypothetical protein